MEKVAEPKAGCGKEAIGPKLVYVIGAGHCGSTLLSLALDRHMDVLSVSEIVGLNAQKSGWAGQEDLRKNDFWCRVAANFEHDFGEDFWSVPFASPARNTPLTVSQWSRQNGNAFLSIAKTADVSFVVDASKQPRRLEALLEDKGTDVRVIYLVRDARAIVHSYDRKYRSIWRGFRQLKRLDRRARSIKKHFRSVPWMTLRYEDMTTDFETAVKRICGFCGISFQTEMLQPDTLSFVGVGGNRLRHQPVKAVTLDRSWESGMTAWKQVLISFAFVGYSLRNGFPLLKFKQRTDTIP